MRGSFDQTNKCSIGPKSGYHSKERSHLSVLASQLQKQKNLIQKRYKNSDGNQLFLNNGGLKKLKSEQCSNASTGQSYTMPTSGRASLKRKDSAFKRQEKYKSYFQNSSGVGNETGFSASSNSCERKKLFLTNSQSHANFTLQS